MAENSLEMIREFGEHTAGVALSRGIARLYSQHTRLRAGASGLSTWTTEELAARLNEGEKLLVAGMAISDNSEYQRYLRRAGEIFEWAAASSPADMPMPIVLLAASAYQLAGYPARASGVISEHPLADTTSKVLIALLRADFPEAQRLLLETWQTDGEESVSEKQIDIALLDQLLHALGVLTAWLRWGEDARIETALKTIEKVSDALRYDSDRFSWLLSVLFAAIGRAYQDKALWSVMSPLMRMVSDDGRQALYRYTRVAFLEKKILAWPSQQAGITGIISDGSFALCTPTGSGKTRVAELVILRHLFDQANNQSSTGNPFVLYLAPSRALSAEVEASLSRSLRSIRATSVTVTSLYGGNDFGPSDLASTDEQPTVLISTHEKADALLRFLGPTLQGQITCVIIDEAHAVAFTGKYKELAEAQSRSLRLEGLVSRLKTLCSSDTTFVALSAVAAELRDVLSAWITGVDNRLAIAPDYRSTRQLFGKLLCAENGTMTIQYNVLDGQRLLVDDQDSAPYVPNPFPPHPPTPNTFGNNDSAEKRMRAHLLWAAMHFAQVSGGKRHSVLISVTEHPEYYAGTFLDLLTDDWADVNCPSFFAEPDDERKQALLSRCLESCADYFGPMSREYRLLEKGIVLHHGKMPPVMSRLLIELIQLHVINIVIATSTLSEGVNLPFETVLIPSLIRWGRAVNVKEIINVAGRAGRPGVSTEGKTLVLLSASYRGRTQRISRQAYQNVVQCMTGESTEKVDGPQSPLHALMAHIARQWSILSGSDDHEQFIGWLETTAYSPDGGVESDLLTSLDTFDQQLLKGIEESESLNPSIEVEDFLRSLWRNTLARHDSNTLDEEKAQEMFTRRGVALTQTIYPEGERRRALYHTGLPPRDGSVLVERLSDIKSILQEAVNYVAWSRREQLGHFERLIETTSPIEAFGIRDLNIGRSRIPWSDVLTWWMAPDLVKHSPTPNSVSRWYDFASKHFIYGLNWAIGSIIGSIMERDGGDGQFLERWEHCDLPWSVMWYKDMISWGTLDPIASYALTKKVALTRPVALDIADQYWTDIDEISDAALEPRRVIERMQPKEPTRSKMEEEQRLPYNEIDVALAEDFSEHIRTQFRVLPAISGKRIDWYDPAGFLLAYSEVPENWQGLRVAETDFILDPSSKTVIWRDYI
jgi:superfamily II DNA/RNA helicase